MEIHITLEYVHMHWNIIHTLSLHYLLFLSGNISLLMVSLLVCIIVCVLEKESLSGFVVWFFCFFFALKFVSVYFTFSVSRFIFSWTD